MCNDGKRYAVSLGVLDCLFKAMFQVFPMCSLNVQGGRAMQSAHLGHLVLAAAMQPLPLSHAPHY